MGTMSRMVPGGAPRATSAPLIVGSPRGGAPARPASAFGGMLRSLRAARRMSQEELALGAEVSPRHLSFLENGRAQPSREMVLALGNALDLPLRDRNALLGAANFAAAYRESSLDGPAMASVRRALDLLLNHHEPFPAVVVDAAWDITRLNQGAMRVFGEMFAGSAPPGNLVRALLEPSIRSRLVNFDDLAAFTLQRLHREASLAPEGAPVRRLAEEMAGRPEMRLRSLSVRPTDVVVPMHLRFADRDLRFFTTITTLGTPLDVTAEEVRIESYFPMDEVTAAWVRGLSAG